MSSSVSSSSSSEREAYEMDAVPSAATSSSSMAAAAARQKERVTKKKKKNKGKEVVGKKRVYDEELIESFHWCEPREVLEEIERSHPNDFCIIKDEETIVEALHRMDSSLLLKRGGKSVWGRTIPRGRIGLCVKRETKPVFVQEGTYWRTGLFTRWVRPNPIVSLTAQYIENQTVSILTLTDGEGAVIRQGASLRSLGKGRYIIREPFKVVRIFNEGDFQPVERERTTVDGNIELRLLGRQIAARQGNDVFGCRFIQVAPGCCAVVQLGDKLALFPEGWYQLKSLDHTVARWLDLREVSNTVMNIKVTTSNQAQMSVDVYIRTRLDDPIAFTEACEYSDMQDALDDKSLDVMQTLVGSRTYASILEDVKDDQDSFDMWLSSTATAKLRPYAQELGGELLELSIVRRSFNKDIQRTLDKQAEVTLELETKRQNVEKRIDTERQEALAQAERWRIKAEGEAEAMKIQAAAERHRIEEEASARAKAVQLLAGAYQQVEDPFARQALLSETQIKKYQALGDKTLIIPEDLTSTTMDGVGRALGMDAARDVRRRG
ncbi:hypothetical protein QOT17_003393 [Balamuthia mandrillaris]